MRIRFWQNTVCKGAGLVRKELKEQGYNAMRVRQTGSRFKGRSGDLIINWGSQRDIPSRVIGNATVLNPPSNIRNASLKVNTYKILSEHDVLSNHILEHGYDIEWAKEQVERGATVYCRTKINSSKGRGIVIVDDVDSIPHAPFYTVALSPDNREVRLHVFNGEVIDFAQKKQMNSTRLEDEGITVNPMIKSYDNGYIFAREGVTVPDFAKEIAIQAVEAMGLHHSSIDMVLDGDLEFPIILEINTASGMQGTTVKSYANAIKNFNRGAE